MTHKRPDVIDRAAGLSVLDGLMALRAERPEFLNGADMCRASVLTPKEDLALAPDLRLAIARRIILTSDNPDLIAEYPVPGKGDIKALAQGDTPDDPMLRAIAQHTDMIAQNPSAASRAHLEALLQAGLSVPQVIALSELMAFATFQIRVVHGLSIMKDLS